MKKLLLLILFPLSFYAQTDSVSIIKPKLSVIGLNKTNVVYRGMPNPISVAVNNAKSFKISGDDVSRNDEGNYVIQPKFGNETKVLLDIETLDTTLVVEEHTFKVKDLPYAALLVNKKGCINGDCIIEMPGKELLNAEIAIKLIDYLSDYSISITGFRLMVSNSNGVFLDSFEIKGNKIPQDVYNEISKNDKVSLIIIHKIVFTSDLNLSVFKTPIIKIKKV